MLEEEVKSLKDQVTMLQHMLQAKDEVIVKLTNDMYELEKNNNDPHSAPKPSSPTIRKSVVFDTDTRELEKLRVIQSKLSIHLKNKVNPECSSICFDRYFMSVWREIFL